MTNLTRLRISLIQGGLAREIVARLIVLAFTETQLRSEGDEPSRASKVLGISDRHIRRLLKQDHDAGWPIVMTLIVIVGFETALSLIMAEEG